MNKFGWCLVSVGLLAAQNVAAEEYFSDLPKLDLSANAAWVSDYRFRGISQSDEKPALQVGGDLTYAVSDIVDVYAGAWGSSIDFNDDDQARYEVDYYGGVGLKYSDLSFDFGFIYYSYPGAAASLNYNFLEYTASAAYDLDGFLTTLSVNYSPDNFGGSGDAVYTKLAAEYSFYPHFTLNGYVGHQYIEDDATFLISDYNDWGFGASYEFEDLFTLGLNYVATDIPETECSSNCDGTLILSVSKSF